MRERVNGKIKKGRGRKQVKERIGKENKRGQVKINGKEKKEDRES